MQYYAGIGSRQTPSNILGKMRKIAKDLCCYKDLILRTGGAHGADTAFEAGCMDGGGTAHLFLPWRAYNDRFTNVVMESPTIEAIELAKVFHPVANRLSDGALKLHGRNSHIILGPNLDEPVLFVICYAIPNKGGTSQALRIANHAKIPIINLYSKTADEQLEKLFAVLNLNHGKISNFENKPEQIM